MTTISIDRDEASAFHYALSQHIQHLDELLGDYYMWPSERRRMLALMQRLHRVAEPTNILDDIEDCPAVNAEAAISI